MTGSVLRALYAEMSAQRRRDLGLTLAFMVLAAAAELVSIGAVLPFLALALGAGGEALPGASVVRFLLGDTVDTGVLLSRAVALLAGAAVAAAVIRLAVLRLSQSFVFSFGHEISTVVFSRAMRQPYSWYLDRNPSEVFAGLDKISVLINGVLAPLMQAVIASVVAAAIATLLLLVAPGLTLVAGTVVGVIYLGISLASRRWLRSNGVIMAAMSNARVKALHEGHGGLRDILLARANGVFEDKFRRLDSAYRKAQADNLFLASAPRYLVEATGMVLVGLLALRFGREPGGVSAALPLLGVLAFGAQRLFPLLNMAYFGWSQFLGNRAVLEDVVVLMHAPVVPDAPACAPAVFTDAVVFDGVGLSYPGRRLKLAQIDLVIPRGARLGLTGPTGGGKSSLLDLFTGVLDPTEGRILIDGAPLGAVGKRAWQSSLAHVPQSIYLADASIAANIAFGQAEADIDMDRVAEAARRAQLASFVDGLADGYATPVGDRGVRLSGGQRQRLGIARALYRDAKVLVLDEATGQLDAETERGILHMLVSLPRTVTLVMASHSPAVLAAMEQVVRVEEGRIVSETVS